MIDSQISSKRAKLEQLLASLGSTLVAFSGGTDSSYLAYVARNILGSKAMAGVAVSETYPKAELKAARLFAGKIRIPLIECRSNEFSNPAFVENSLDRCYFCKTELFQLLQGVALTHNLACIVDGTNLDDLADHRPGRRAAIDMGVRSPLLEVGLSKSEIRILSKDGGLPTWDKPAQACLASRIPYGEELTIKKLAQVERSEQALKELGFREIRVRHHGKIARLEFGTRDLSPALKSRLTIIEQMKAIGFTYVCLDLAGYRLGSMGEG